MTFAKHGGAWCSLLAALVLAGCATRSAPPAQPGPALPELTTPEASPAPPTPTINPAVVAEAKVIAAVDGENSIFFALAETDVDEAGEQKLRLHAARLKEDNKLRVRLVGYTDNQGSRSYNIALAERRVKAVYDLLRKFGVSSLQLRHTSVGGEMANKSCRSAECRNLMRRVELQYLD
jgi:outer membrane protein OmpA-like peptidoglycan-associated protein